MISRQRTEECIARLGMLKFFPVQPAVVAEVGRLLNELCISDDEAARLCAAILQQFSEWPAPVKVREIFGTEIASHRPRPIEPAGCELCQGMGGWRYVFHVISRLADGSKHTERIYPEGNQAAVADQADKLRRSHESQGRMFYEVVAPCRCELGRRRADDMDRRAEERAGNAGR